MAEDKPGLRRGRSVAQGFSDQPSSRSEAHAADANGAVGRGRAAPMPKSNRFRKLLWPPKRWVVLGVLFALSGLYGIAHDLMRGEASGFSFWSEGEEKPGVGASGSFSVAQLRYCLAQGARIDGAVKVASRESERDRTLLRALVDDFNSRCGKGTYRKRVGWAVTTEVEGRRQQLEAEGGALLRAAASP